MTTVYIKESLKSRLTSLIMALIIAAGVFLQSVFNDFYVEVSDFKTFVTIHLFYLFFLFISIRKFLLSGKKFAFIISENQLSIPEYSLDIPWTEIIKLNEGIGFTNSNLTIKTSKEFEQDNPLPFSIFRKRNIKKFGTPYSFSLESLNLDPKEIIAIIEKIWNQHR